MKIFDYFKYNIFIITWHMDKSYQASEYGFATLFIYSKDLCYDLSIIKYFIKSLEFP